METSGRERRHRYYSTGAYRELLSKENFEAPDVLSSDDVALTGDFAQQEENAFYGEKGTLRVYQDSYTDKINNEKPRKRPLKNPILPDGRVKLGRPRKNQAATLANAAVESSSKSTPIATSSPAKKRRTDAMPADKIEGPSYQSRDSYSDFDSYRFSAAGSKARATEGEANIVNHCPESQKTRQIRGV